MKIKEIVSNDEVKALAEKVQEQGTETANEWFKHKFEAHEKEKESVKAFRTQLKEIAEADEKPIVIFIDELDRCRPDFAVKIIERIKHFFNVENVVFVLLLNREQLQNAVKGVYGEKTDAATYLGKFVNFFFTLPKQEYSELYRSHTYLYAHEEAKKYHNIRINMIAFSSLAIHFNSSLRDIERAMAIYVFSSVSDNSYINEFVIYAIFLKLKNPNIFKSILSNERSMHSELAATFRKAHQAKTPYIRTYSTFGMLADWHEFMLETEVDTSLFTARYKHLALINNGNLPFDDLKNIFSISTKKIDLSVD